jgi:biotin carboxyl carrier protein
MVGPEPGVAVVKICAKAGQQLLDVTVERRNGIYEVDVDGTHHEVDVYKLEGDFFSFLVGDKSYEVSVEATRDGYRVRHGAAEQLVTLTDAGRQAREGMGDAKGPTSVVSVMPGKVVRILVNEGDEVEAGQGVVVVEAMKMENEIGAPKAGTVKSITAAPDQAVEAGAELLVIE